MSKIKLAVLFGGRSTEHEVSCVSAYSIITNLDKSKYDVVQIGVSKQGDWTVVKTAPETIKDLSWEKKFNKSCPCHKPSMVDGIKALEKVDCVFNIIHGQNGEDGTVQGLLELMNKPYVGPGVLASAAGMDKVYTKIILDAAGIPQCKSLVVLREILQATPVKYVEEVRSKLGYPCFVKPSNCGSSVGVRKVHKEEDLLDALNYAAQFDRKVLVEEFVDGREIECAVLGNEDARAAMPGEIKATATAEFYDYDDKYKSGTSVAVIPAEIPSDALEQIRTYAVRAYHALDAAGLSRVDFFYKKDGTIFLNEINTLPGFTEISMYPKMWIHEGMTYSGLLDALIDAAFARKAETARKEVQNG